MLCCIQYDSFFDISQSGLDFPASFNISSPSSQRKQVSEVVGEWVYTALLFPVHIVWIKKYMGKSVFTMCLDVYGTLWLD